MPLFTVENAASFGRAGAIARWTAPKQTAIEPAATPAIAEPTPVDIEIKRVRAYLDKLDELMTKAKDDRTWDNLSRSYERMFRAWTHLAGIAAPKPQVRVKDPSRRSRIEPIEPTCASEPTTNSVPTSQPQNNTPQST